MAKPKETDLYPPVKKLLEDQGYEVKSEIGAADVVAIDEDGRLLEKLSTYQLKKPDELGKKWHPEQK